MANVHQKTSAQVPVGFRLSRKPPIGDPQKAPPTEDEPREKPAISLFKRVMDTIPEGTMQYPVPFPSLAVVLDRHPEVFHLRQQFREKDLMPHANAVSQIVNYMFEQIINFEEPHDYFAKKNDESLWYYIGTFVTKILDTMTNGDSELDNDIEKKFELYNRAILLSQPGHVLDRIGYDVSNPNGDGGFDNDMFSGATMSTVDKPKINFDYTPYYTERDYCGCFDMSKLEIRSLVLREFVGPQIPRGVDTTYDADKTREWSGFSYLTPGTILETDDMIDRRLRNDFKKIRWPKLAWNSRVTFRINSVDDYIREHSKFRSATVHNALIDSKIDLIKGICAFVVGDIPIPENITVPKTFCEMGTQTEDLESECIAAQPAPEYEYDELEYRGPWDTLSEDSHSVKHVPSEYGAAVVIQSGLRSYLVRQCHAMALATIKLYALALREDEI